MPPYLWDEAKDEIATIESIFEQWGLPYDVTQDTAQWDAAFGNLSSYAMAFVPGYLPGWAIMGTPRSALEDFARGGGIVVITKPVTDSTGDALALCGLGSSVRGSTSARLRVDGGAAALTAFNSPEERSIPLTDDPVANPVDAYAFTTTGDTKALAELETPDGDHATITRRPLGLGGVYAIGHALHSFGGYRCYVNCFEPAGDLLGLLLRDALREGSRGHVVLKHTVPGLADTAVVTSHDVDAPDAQKSGAWGEPGAVQMARIEQPFSAHGTYFITTDYSDGYYTASTLGTLCQLGMCPRGTRWV